jgi:glycosyltransferase involved in cell wall biosynthesis
MLFPRVRTAVFYPICDTRPPLDVPSLREKWREHYGATCEKYVIFAASRIEAGKGLDILIEALCLLKNDPSWVCLIGGQPQQYSEHIHLNALKSIALRGGIESRIRWLGHVQDMNGHFAAADIYCQPNRFPESFGMTFVEAQAMGCSVVTTGVGGALETIEQNGRNILLEKPCPELVARAIADQLALKK